MWEPECLRDRLNTEIPIVNTYRYDINYKDDYKLLSRCFVAEEKDLILKQYSLRGRDPRLKGSIWFHDFWLAPPNKDIDKIGRPPI